MPPGSKKAAECLMPGTRAIVWLDIHQVGTSCGFSVPVYGFEGYRRVLEDFARKRVKSDEEGRGEDGLERYWAFKNQRSLDGLPGLVRGVEAARRDGVVPIRKFVGLRECYGGSKGLMGWVRGLGFLVGVLVGVVIMVVLQNRAELGVISQRLRHLGLGILE